MTRITGFRTWDLRFPSEAGLDGSDATKPDPVYSAAYVRLETDGSHEGHGLTFTIGRGAELCVAAIEALRGVIVSRDTDGLLADPAGFWRGDRRESASLGWSGERRDPYRCGRCGECGLRSHGARGWRTRLAFCWRHASYALSN